MPRAFVAGADEVAQAPSSLLELGFLFLLSGLSESGASPPPRPTSPPLPAAAGAPAPAQDTVREPPPPGTDSGENSSQAPPFATPVSPGPPAPLGRKENNGTSNRAADEAAHPRTTTSFAKTPGQPVISSFYFQACEGAVLQVFPNSCWTHIYGTAQTRTLQGGVSYSDKNASPLRFPTRCLWFFSLLWERVLEAPGDLRGHSTAGAPRKRVKEIPILAPFGGKRHSSSSSVDSPEASSLMSNQRRPDEDRMAHLYRGTQQRPLKRGHRGRPGGSAG